MIATLLGIERDIGRLGFDRDEVKSNSIGYGPPGAKEVNSKQYLAPHHSWMGSEKEPPQKHPHGNAIGEDGLTNWERVKKAREEADARYAAIHSKK